MKCQLSKNLFYFIDCIFDISSLTIRYQQIDIDFLLISSGIERWELWLASSTVSSVTTPVVKFLVKCVFKCFEYKPMVIKPLLHRGHRNLFSPEIVKFHEINKLQTIKFNIRSTIENISQKNNVKRSLESTHFTNKPHSFEMWNLYRNTTIQLCRSQKSKVRCF